MSMRKRELPPLINPYFTGLTDYILSLYHHIKFNNGLPYHTEYTNHMT